MSLLRSIAAGMTWKRVLAVEGFAGLLLIEQWLGLDESEKFGRYIAVTSVTFCASALFFLAGALGAAESVRRGVSTPLAYGAWMLTAGMLGSLVHTSLWFDWAWRSERSIALFFLEQIVELGSWAALAGFVYWNRVNADRLQDQLRRSQIRSAQVERRLLKSRLDTARAQIDAPQLSEELARISGSLRIGDAAAVDALDDLIHRLRSNRSRPANADEAT